MLAARARPCAFCLTALTLAAVQPAEAQDRRVAVDVPPGPLARGLESLAAQTGISVGATGPLPALTTRAVKGRMTPVQALDRLLAGTGLRAIPVGPGAYRLVRAPAAPAPPRRPAPPPRAPAPAPPEVREAEIVVTGLRRPQPLFSAPASMSVVPGSALDLAAASRASHDVALRVDGLTLTNLGQGRNRQFIRGVADSAFNGYSQSTVAVVVDGSRVTYDAPDPDLRLVDVDRVEVLKGPQGPLYGSGALGGVYHIVTRRPEMRAATASAEAYGAAVGRGGLGGGGSATLNLPVLPGRLALRASAYGAAEPGWIDGEGGPRNANAGRLSGGRAALRWLPAPGWTVDMMALAQFMTVDDSQYVPAGAGAYRRPARMREPHDNDIRMVAASLSGRIGQLRVDGTASLVRHEVGSRLDASGAAGAFGESPPLAFEDDRKYRVLDQELRLSGGSQDRVNWIAGASYLSATSRIDGIIDPAAAPSRQVVRLARQASEAALFGQASLPLSPAIRLEAGLRLFRAMSEDELEESETGSAAIRLSETRTRLAPSLSLSWSPAPGKFLFARFAMAERAAGLGVQASGAPARFASDHLASFELGGRLRVAGLSVDGALFHSRWTDVQSDFLLPSGLIATHNAGDAEIWGGEASARLSLGGGWSIDTGAVVQRARLVRGTGAAPLPDDRRLPVVPAIAARAALTRPIRIGGWAGAVETVARFNGSQRLSFDAGLDRRTPGYVLAGAAARLSKGVWTLSLDLDNLIGSHADTFGFGNPFSIRQAAQRTPIRPRSATLSLQRKF